MKRIMLAASVVLLSAGLAAAQNADTANKTGNQNKPLPVNSGKYEFVVQELRGTAYLGGPQADPKNPSQWTKLKVGDKVPPLSQISTEIRSTVKLTMNPSEPPTVVMIESLALVLVDEMYKTKDANGAEAVRVSLGIAQGAIRAGVVEGGDVKSDLTIHSPEATLAKKGTWDFRIFVERGTGHFQISLASRGLVQAIQNSTGRSVSLRQGQFVRQSMLRWVETVKFNRNITIQDWYGLRGTELIFNLANQGGLGVLSPGGNPIEILNVTGRLNQQAFLDSLDPNILDLLTQPQGNRGLNLGTLPILDTRFGPRRRPEGDFGIGTGVIPIFLNSSSRAVQKRIAMPGRMDFWKSDLQRLAQQNKNLIKPRR